MYYPSGFTKCVVDAYLNTDRTAKEQKDYGEQIPFYMAYPVPMLYDDDRNARRDYDYMKSIYPDAAKRVLPYIEEECDRMEYDGSMMYDEYPDRLQLRLMCRRIYDKAEKEENDPGTWLMDLIEVMTYQELCRRRAEHRDIRKKIY